MSRSVFTALQVLLLVVTVLMLALAIPNDWLCCP